MLPTSTALALPSLSSMMQVPSTVRPINIYDIYRNIQAKKIRKYATFDMILERVYMRIQRVAEIDQMQMVYDVPNFIPGIPLYDVRMCTAYIIAQLRKNGFVVRYIPPTNLIYISWDFRELNVGKKQEDEVERILSEQWPSSSKEEKTVVKSRGRGRGKSLGPSASPPTPLPFTPEATSSRDHKPVIAQPPDDIYGYGGGSISSSRAIMTSSPFPETVARYKPSGKFVLNLS
jgi:hypothetical protein